MFKNKTIRRQMITVGISLLMVFAIAQVASRFGTQNPRNWEVTAFENMYISGISFGISHTEDGLRVTLTNTSEEEMRTAAAFDLALYSENEWRLVPFGPDTVFGTAVTLPPGYSATFSLTRDMLAVNLHPGTYRFRTTVNNSPVWVEFELEEF
jgi:hypothetical protein